MGEPMENLWWLAPESATTQKPEQFYTNIHSNSHSSSDNKYVFSFESGWTNHLTMHPTGQLSISYLRRGIAVKCKPAFLRQQQSATNPLEQLTVQMSSLYTPHQVLLARQGQQWRDMEESKTRGTRLPDREIAWQSMHRFSTPKLNMP